MDYSLPGSSVFGVSQARKLEWFSISISRGSSWSKGQTHVSCIAGEFFPTEPLGQPHMAFIMLRRVPSMPTFWRVFIINWFCFSSKPFWESMEILIWFLFFSLSVWYITLYDLWILKNPCILGINPTWSWCMLFLLYCGLSLRIFYRGFLHPCWAVIWAYNFLYFFFCGVFV